MRPLEIIPSRLLEYEPPSSCHDIISSTLAAIGLGAGEAAAGAGAAAGLTMETATAAEISAALGESVAATSSLPSLSTIGTVASVAGTGLQAMAQSQQSKYEQEVAKQQAAALKIKAGEEAAAAQRQQATELRKAGLITSRARALAASSGTDATSPTELTNESLIGQQGDYNALSALYSGLSASRADTYQADIDLFKAQRLKAAAPLAMGGTILSGISSFADKRAIRKLYGGGGGFFGFGDT